MKSKNNIQVQSTNDACAVSKYSAVRKNYFEDDFIEYFVPKKKNRAPLIHLGYYTRAVIMTEIIKKFINFLLLKKVFKFQIISCGSGFDTTYWKLSKNHLENQDFVFVEIDFPEIINKKINFINQSPILKSFVKGKDFRKSEHINQINSNHFILGADLNDIGLLEEIFDEIGINYDAPTLFLSECVITYMKAYDSDKLIYWMGTKFKNSALLNYEQIHPDDGFGEVMLSHFDKQQSPLFSVSKYPDLESHQYRYKDLGFENSLAVSEWNAFVHFTDSKERKRALCLELFDEFEEFHMKCLHYVVAIAGNKVLSEWISWLCLSHQNVQNSINETTVYVNTFPCNLHLYRHSSFKVKNDVYLFGGCTQECRSDKIFKIECSDYSKSFSIKPVECLKEDLVQLDVVHASLSHFSLNQIPYICLFGGRRSPDKIGNNGAAVIFEIDNDKVVQKIVTVERNPLPRYRTSLASLKKSDCEVHFWLFGGRTSDLNVVLSDFWELVLKSDEDRNLTYKWIQHEKDNENWPSGRMSHSCIGCPKRNAVFVIGGLNLDSGCPLGDVWMWCCETRAWQELKLKSKLTPRYGQTAHLVENEIFLIGGISFLDNHQTNFARIHLNDLTVTEFTIKAVGVEPYLMFNHSSEIVGCKEGEEEILVFGGGGNCFSFGTHLNPGIIQIKCDQIIYYSDSNSISENDVKSY